MAFVLVCVLGQSIRKEESVLLPNCDKGDEKQRDSQTRVLFDASKEK